ncbi:MAG: glycosyltransferase family 2 protein [Clostridiales bacterium]|nr:glycosyltransferase family 2 protein [Clostridiales bacterium]
MITIVIPNYNGVKYLGQCLESIYLQDYIDYEIIVVDNHSTDNIEELIERYYEKKLIFIKLDKNYGFSRAVNEGIKQAKGKYVLLLNNDTELHQSFLSNIVVAMERDQKVFAVSSKMIQYRNRNLIDDAGDEYTVIGWAQKRGEGKTIDCFTKRQRVFSACAGAALYRKSIFEEIGYFDETFFAYLEDIDISYRANIFGYKNVYEPNAIVYHIGSATSGGGNSDFKLRLTGRNNVYLLYKNMPIIQLIINMPFLIIGHLVRIWILKRIGYDRAYREGVKEGIKGLKDIKKTSFKRKNIFNYIKIEWELCKNTFIYLFWQKYIILNCNNKLD